MASLSDEAVDFEDPPVVEVAIAVQFEALSKLTTPHLGVFWQSISADLPRVEEYLPRPAAFETFPRQEEQVQRLLVQLRGEAQVSRCWFISDDDSQLVQVQADRFVFNWRKREGPYPRYEFVRRRFDQCLVAFERFLEENDLGAIEPNQCEISYVNDVDAPPDTVKSLTPLWRGEYSDDFLAGPVGISLHTVYEIRRPGAHEPSGRLHVALQSDEEPEGRRVLTMTARGRPEPEDIRGVGDFLDLGHEWIVHGFVSVTTPGMHKKWGIRHDDGNAD